MSDSSLPPAASPEPQASNTELRKELLIKDLENWCASFWKNEEAGERRLQFMVTLVTAVMAGLVGLYQYSLQHSPPDEAARLLRSAALPALAGLLLLGFVTYLRMVRRNAVTDGYKERADSVRRRVLGKAEFEALYPKPPGRSGMLGRVANGGLAVVTAVLNSFVAALLLAFGQEPDAMEGAWTVGAVTFAVAFLLHLVVAEWLKPLGGQGTAKSTEPKSGKAA